VYCIGLGKEKFTSDWESHTNVKLLYPQHVHLVISDRIPDILTYLFEFLRYIITRTWLCYVRVFAITNPSVCTLSVVCNFRAPYSAGWNFPECFYAILYPSHPLVSIQNFTEIVPEELPLCLGLNARWVAKYSDVGHVEGYRERCKIGPRVQLMTNMKSYP